MQNKYNELKVLNKKTVLKTFKSQASEMCYFSGLFLT